MTEDGRLHFDASVDTVKPTPIHRYFYDYSHKELWGKSVLDIGCWTGSFESLFPEESGTRFVSTDIEAEPLAVARAEMPQNAYARTSALDLPFASGTFDAVTLWAVFEHVPKGTEPRLLQEINRVLKPGGVFFLNTMNATFLSCALDPAWFLKGHRHYTRAEMEAYIADAGLVIEDYRLNGRLFTPMYMNLFYVYKHILRRRLPLTPKAERRGEIDYAAPGGWNEINLRARKPQLGSPTK